MFPKPKTPRDAKYLKFLRSLPCTKCKATYEVDSHHTETGGMGLTGSDYSALPLCRICHCDLHRNCAKGGFWKEEELKNILSGLKARYEESRI
jgi:hypothetical protein